MKNIQTIILVLVVVIIGGALIFSNSKKGEMAMQDSLSHDDSMMMEKEGENMTGDSMMKEESSEMMMHDEMMGVGSYEAYASEKIARANEGKVVLFFRAGWCPTCRALDKDIKANLESIPKNVTILDVNYDTEKALKTKYGVTYQHTFVEVDAEGNAIKKWSGSPTLSALLGEII